MTSFEQQSQVDRVSENFAAEWRSGCAPNLQSYLSANDDAIRSELIAELVPQDIHFRRAAGLVVSEEDYRPYGALAARLARRWLKSPECGESRRTAGGGDCDSTIIGRESPGGAVSAAAFGENAGAGDPRERAALPKSGELFGDYRLEQLLGSGGMGVVYRAVHRRLGRVVAIKLIRDAALIGTEERARFEREARAAARLSHRNIVTVYEFGYAGSLPYFTMELVRGPSLAEFLKQRGPLTVHEAATLLRPVASAVAYAHDNGVIHRDLKPANLLLDEDHVPRIADFGLARAENDGMQLTTSGTILGTPSYMAPEQAAGRTAEVGRHSDIYALGAVLYECLTGVPPFRAENAQLTLMQVLEEPVVAPRQRRQEISRDAESVCMKCLARLPEHRYSNANDLVADLDRLLSEQPVQARSRTMTEAMQAWIRNHVALLAMMVSLICTLPVLFSPWLSFVREPRTSDANAGDPAVAMAVLSEWILRDSRNGALFCRRAEHRYQSGMFADAKADATSALMFGCPQPAVAYQLLGLCELAMGHTQSAESAFTTALGLQDSLCDARLGRGETRWQLGRHAEALDDLNAVIRLQPDNVRAYLLRTKILEATGAADAARSDRAIAVKLTGGSQPRP